MTLHAEIKSMRTWWSAEARAEFTNIADELVAVGVPATQVMSLLRRSYNAAAKDEAEGGDGVRIEAVSLRRVDLQTQVGNSEDGAAIMETTPTIELRVRSDGGWKQLLSRPLAQISDGKLAEVWDAEALNNG